MKKPLTYFIITITILGCGQNSNENTSAESIKNTPEKQAVEHFQIEEIYDIFSTIPAPFERSDIFMSFPKNFNNDLLFNQEIETATSSNFKKGMLLGILGTNLSYSNIYNQTEIALAFLTSIRNLAVDLRISNFFDIQLKGLRPSDALSLDSLVRTTFVGYHKMKTTLVAEKREDVALYIITGSWLEGMYYLINFNNENNNPALEDEIMNQKYNLQTIKQLWNKIEKTDESSATYILIQNLETAYDSINSSPPDFSNLKEQLSNFRNGLIKTS